LKSIKAIACAFASALAVLVFTFGLLGPHAAAQSSTDYTPSSVEANNQGQGQGVGAGNVANTGSNSTIPLTTLGIGLLSVGGLAIALARRRRTVSAAA
jgi:LPXTG-motif cell wall-anchored protein